MSAAEPAPVVVSLLFPPAQEPLSGVFIRERVFRVAKVLPVTVVSPRLWVPIQWLLRFWWPAERTWSGSFVRYKSVCRELLARVRAA